MAPSEKAGREGPARRSLPVAQPIQFPDAPTPLPTSRTDPRKPNSKSSPQEKESAGEKRVPKVKGIAPPLSEAPPKDVFEAILRNAPSWAISAVLHIVFLVLLGLLAAAYHYAAPITEIAAKAFIPEGPEFETAGVQLEDPNPPPDGFASEKGPGDDQFVGGLNDPNLSREGLFSGADELANITIEAPTIGNSIESAIGAPPLGSANIFANRRMGKVGDGGPLGKYGGTPASEEAVQRGLKWLVKQQGKDGLWSLQGPFPNGVTRRNNAAATAMALLAFQGNGNTHLDGPYKDVVERGKNALLRLQAGNGDFFQQERRDDWLYTQAQCTIAICELFAMSQDEKLREPAEKAVKFCIDAQSEEGGWRYRPKDDSDLSVTGWMVMALKSAQGAGLSVPTPVFTSVTEFLDKVARDDGGAYTYHITDGRPSKAMTAEGLLCRQYLGWPRDDKRLLRGVHRLLESDNLPSMSDGEQDTYYWYYATQVMHHMGGEEWKKWNNVQRDLLVKSQERGGAIDGSWNPERDAWGGQIGGGGRLYTTCLSIYMLEVYYRHMPLYNLGGNAVAKGEK